MTEFTLKIDRPRLDRLLATARERARTGKRPVLVTLTQSIEKTDPLSALESVSRAGSSAFVGSLIDEGRMYWTCPRDEFALAGIGALATFDPEGTDRFSTVDGYWSDLLDGAVTGNPDDGTPGLGPVLMGGFAFDPNTPQTGLWEGFSSAHMIVPRVLFTSVGEESWITVALVMDENGNSDEDPDELNALLAAASVPVHRETDRASNSDAAGPELTFMESRTAADWRSLVSSAVSEICSGDMQKVVLARDVHGTATDDIDVFATLDHLRDTHRNSFVFGYWRGSSTFIGATPERLVRIDGRKIHASSLAGTEKRGATPEEDSALASLLLSSSKDLAEHAAVRDALFDALSEISDDVEAARTPSLLTLPHLHHLHTPVSATLREGHSLLEVVARLHPTPAVGGTPREAALRFIRENEQLDRGWYAAPIGWIGRGSGEFAVALRSAVVNGPEATLFAGCGIVADSDPELEYRESVLKLRPMQLAIFAATSETKQNLSEVGATADVTR
jgi:isochorismate synthase